MEINKALCGSIIIPTLMFVSETWTWNCYISRIKAMEMSYLKGACGLNRMNGKSNESMYKKFGLSIYLSIYL